MASASQDALPRASVTGRPRMSTLSRADRRLVAQVALEREPKEAAEYEPQEVPALLRDKYLKRTTKAAKRF